MDRTQKEELVAKLNKTFDESEMVVVTHYSGLTVAEISDLRDRIRESGANFKVTKNRLTRLALKDTKFEGISDLFTGPTAIAYSDDPVAAAKASVEFSKKNEKLIVLGGALGSERLDPTASRRWQRCHPSTNYVERLWAFCRRRPPRLPRCSKPLAVR